MTKEQRANIIDKATDLIYEDLNTIVERQDAIFDRLKSYIQGYLLASDYDAETLAKWALYTVAETIHIYKEDLKK